jgi:hypothetical protein
MRTPNPTALDKVIVTAGSLFFPGIRTRLEAEPGGTIRDLVTLAKIPERYHSFLNVWLDEMPIPQKLWPRIKPRAGHILAIGMAPAGDLTGANGKDTLQMAIPVLLQVGLFAGATLLGAPGILAGALALGGGAIGTWIAQNLIHVPEPVTNPAFTTISGARNQIRKYECIPRVFGRIRYAPPMAAMSVTSIEGQDQFIRVLLTPGFGPLDVQSFKIGDIAIEGANAAGIMIEKACHRRGDVRRTTLFTHDVYEPAPIERQLDYAEDWVDSSVAGSPTHEKVVTVFTQPETVEIGLDFLFPEGLYKEDNKETRSYPVDLMIRYRLKGSTGASSWVTFVPQGSNPLHVDELIDSTLIDWLTRLNTALNDTINALTSVAGATTATLDLIGFTRPQVSTLDGTLGDAIASGALNANEIAAANTTRGYLGTLGGLIDAVDSTVDTLVDGASEFNDTLSQVITVLNFVNDIHSLIQAVRNSEGDDISTLPAWQRTLIYLFNKEEYFQPPPAGSFTLRTEGDSRAPLWKSVSWTVPDGEYEIQVRRACKNKYKDATVHSRVVLFTHRSVTNEYTVSDEMRDKLALVAMKIKVTNQWNNQLDQITMMCESPLPWHDGVEWQWPAITDVNGYNVSRNPAWQMCEILRGNGAKEPIDDDNDIDLVKIREFADWCNLNGYTCDIVFDKRVSAEDAMMTVCRCGKATPSKTGEGKYTVIIDKPQTTPVALTTPRVVKNFIGSKSMEERPHALRVKFQNADKDFQEDESYVYADGYGIEHGLAEPTIIEDVEMPGTTSPTMVKHLGRYFLACSELRPEVFQADIDFKYIVFERGDLVLLQHDVPLFGRGSARITALEVIGTQTFVTLDEHPTAWAWGAGASNAIRIQTAGNLFAYAPCIYDPEVDPDRLYVDEPYPTNWASIAVGDLVAVGSIGLETVECIVRGIAPGPELTARVTFIEHAPAVHDADNDIPEYDSKITLPYNPELARPPRPEVIGISVSDSATAQQTDGTRAARILLLIRLPRGVTASERAAAQTVTGVEVQYQRVGSGVPAGALPGPNPGAGDPWEVMPVFTRDLVNVYVDPVEKGKRYNIRVRSVTRTGVPSMWFVLQAVMVVGKEGPPPDVTGLKYEDGVLSWRCNLPTDHAGFEVRHIYGAGYTWENAFPLKDGVVWMSKYEAYQFDGGTHQFFVKAKDTSGNESMNAATITVNLSKTSEGIPLAEWTNGHFLTWDYEGLEEITGDQLVGIAARSTWFYDGGGMPFYRGAAAPFYGTAYQNAVITSEPISDQSNANMLYDNREFIFADVDVVADHWRLTHRHDGQYLWPADLENPFWPADMDSDLWPDNAIEYGDVIGKIPIPLNFFDIGDHSFRIEIAPSNTQPVVAQFDVTKDARKLAETGTHLEVPATGDVYLPVTQPFQWFHTVSVSLSAEDDQPDDAAYAVVLDKNPDPGLLGPSVVVYDASKSFPPTRVLGYVDWTVIGH